MSIRQKVAAATGASQGIGAGLVKGFLQRNYLVVANSRAIDSHASAQVLAVAGDVADPKTADRIISGALERSVASTRWSTMPAPFAPSGLSGIPTPTSQPSSASMWPASSMSHGAVERMAQQGGEMTRRPGRTAEHHQQDRDGK